MGASAAAVVLGAALALAAVTPAQAATVCCYRYWGVSAAGSQAYANQWKQSPTVTKIDWNRTYVANEGGAMDVYSQVYWTGGSTQGIGGGASWVYADPGGEVSNAYGRCTFKWTILDPLFSQSMACEIKYYN